MRLLPMAALAATIFSTASLAEPQVARVDLHGFVAGKTFILATGMGALPISYRGNGTMHGRAGSQPLAAYTGQSQDQGVWWVAGGQVCQRWAKWLEGRSHCFTFRVDGRVVHWRSSDGHEGTAVIASN